MCLGAAQGDAGQRRLSLLQVKLGAAQALDVEARAVGQAELHLLLRDVAFEAKAQMQVIETAVSQVHAFAARFELQVSNVECPVGGLVQGKLGICLQFQRAVAADVQQQGQRLIGSAIQRREVQLQLLRPQAARQRRQPRRVLRGELQLGVQTPGLPSAQGIAEIERQLTADQADAGKRPRLR